MKTLLILLLAFPIFSLGQTRTKPLTWKVENNTLSIKFVNEPYDVPGSSDSFGFYQARCRQEYIEVFKNLKKYGAYPIRYEGRDIEDTSVIGLTFKISPSYAFILISDTSGHFWRITKPNALILALDMENKIINGIKAFDYLQVCGCEN